ncbi:hypothetical protein MAR_019962 [Mya arenaria]|uniref:Uncharacterized protein n=1 Tax=Mya arenaria TaxID=6604 RepID=A0ABY7E3N1_MYAAR|nr:hypothetical protein MAR_019962 [Mya arenaria]
MSVEKVLDLMLSHVLRIIYNAPSAGYFLTTFSLHLLANELDACGTVRMNRRRFPVDFKRKGVVKNRGDLKVMQMGDFNMTGQEASFPYLHP